MSMLRTALVLSLLSFVGGSNAPRTVAVSIKNMAFSPSSVQIAIGDSVTWTNADDRDHSVEAKDGSFSSGNLRSGSSFTHRFEKAGKFSYGCSYHPRMKGAVDVKE
jgi:plastocyanin